jgi:hypothetical protein
MGVSADEMVSIIRNTELLLKRAGDHMEDGYLYKNVSNIRKDRKERDKLLGTYRHDYSDKRRKVRAT